VNDIEGLLALDAHSRLIAAQLAQRLES
jgi:hypothetical protein